MTVHPTASLHPHPQADLVPWADSDSHAELMADIEANGIQVPIDALPDGTVLDGRTRLAIAKVLGIVEVPVRWVEPADPVAYMLRMALMRRHLSTQQRKALAGSLIREYPSRSDRSVAKATGISHPTVAAVREELVERGDVESLSTRTDSIGRQQPATKPEPAPEPEPADPWADALAEPETVAALDAGMREVATGQTVRRAPKAVDPIDVITPAQAARFPDVAAAALTADLADAIHAVRTSKLDPQAWAERVERMRPEDIARLRQTVAHVHRWCDAWDALLTPRPLSVVGGTES